MKINANKALHRTAIPLSSIAAGELCRYRAEQSSAFLAGCKSLSGQKGIKKGSDTIFAMYER